VLIIWGEECFRIWTIFIVKGRWVQGGLGISVSIVSGYGLDDRAIEVRSLAEAKGFFL
jgi:hypothetical protein